MNLYKCVAETLFLTTIKEKIVSDFKEDMLR